MLAGLVALAACLGGGPTVPRHLHRAVMRLLRPAESAARRLVILVALRLPMPEVAVPHIAKRTPPPALPFGARIVAVNLGLAAGPPSKRPRADRTASRPPVFPLLDPLRRAVFDRRPVRTSVPQIWVPGYSERLRVVPRRHDDAIDAGTLSRRLAALATALDDLPRQALRFLRWRARNAAERAAGRRRRVAPLRFGRPPGQNRHRTHEVHDILEKLHDLADYALAYPDTS